MLVVENGAGLPPRLLSAIGMVESGRTDPRSGVASSWPWTINVAGTGHFFDTKRDAIAAVEVAQASGVQSIDVGCMQINLMYHPAAFSSLDNAFDPVTNVYYGASFLRQLKATTGNWSAAVAAYHSSTPERGAEYGGRVAAIWPLAASYGLTSHIALAASPRSVEPDVDPFHVMTAEFRSQMIQAVAFRHARDAAVGASPLPTAMIPPGSLRSTVADAGHRIQAGTTEGMKQFNTFRTRRR